MTDFYAKLAFSEAGRVVYYREQAAKWNSGVSTKDARFKRKVQQWAQNYWYDALKAEDRVILYANRIIEQLQREKGSEQSNKITGSS